jgi:hypothetical protein
MEPASSQETASSRRSWTPETLPKGTRVKCKRYGTVMVTGTTDRGWPKGRKTEGQGRNVRTMVGAEGLIFTPTLCELVKTEEPSRAAAILGVTPATIQNYRRILKVKPGKPKKAPSKARKAATQESTPKVTRDESSETTTEPGLPIA